MKCGALQAHINYWGITKYNVNMCDGFWGVDEVTTILSRQMYTVFGTIRHRSCL